MHRAIVVFVAVVIGAGVAVVIVGGGVVVVVDSLILSLSSSSLAPELSFARDVRLGVDARLNAGALRMSADQVCSGAIG